MKPLMSLIVLLLLCSCSRDPFISDCGVLGKCENGIVTDTVAAYQEITGTWVLQGYTFYSMSEEGMIARCEKESTETLVFKSDKTVDRFKNGSLICSGNYSISDGYTLSLYSFCGSGRLNLCDEYLTVINSDVDAIDAYYLRVQ